MNDENYQLLLRKLRSDGRDTDHLHCPCATHGDGHGDRHGSLRVRQQADGKITVKCMAGCDIHDILSAIDFPMEALYPPKLIQRKSIAPAGTPASATAVRYVYHDRSGAEAFRKVRYSKADGGKSFVWERMEDGRWQKGLNGASVSLYRLPQVTAAIAERRTVYVVEGEKDADTLTRLGLCATTAPNGAGKSDQDDKWRDEYTALLKGGHVVVLPDVDAVGIAFGQRILRNLKRGGIDCALIDLRQGYPDMPPKGDITDLVDITGDEKALAILHELEEKAAAASPFALYEEAINQAEDPQLRDYTCHDGRIYTVKQVKGQPVETMLSNFCALITGEVAIDDGQSSSIRLIIRGARYNGLPFPELVVTQEEWESASYTHRWGRDAVLSPQIRARDKLRYCIELASLNRKTRSTQYVATGWRQWEQSPFFVTNDGAIGRESAEVSLTGRAAQYAIPTDRSPPEELDGAAVSLALLRDSYDLRVSAPLTGLMYLAPLTAPLTAIHLPPPVILWLLGRTQSGKSTAAGLFMSHYGAGFCSSREAPASFRDSASALSSIAFTCKDVPLWIDDYHPSASKKQRDDMDTLAQSLIRSYFNRSAPGRAQTNRRLAEDMPPRGVALCTGEQLPAVGESGLSRLYVVEMSRQGRIDGQKLQSFQHPGRDGVIAAGMAGYIRRMIARHDDLPRLLQGLLSAEEQHYRAELADGGGNLVTSTAYLSLGCIMAIRYFTDEGMLADDEAADLLTRVREALAENAREQLRSTMSCSPTEQYVTALRELIAAGVLELLPKNTQEKHKPVGLAGYLDEAYYYIIPGVAYSAVNRQSEQCGSGLALNKTALHRLLVEEGYVIPYRKPDGSIEPCTPVSIGGKTVRLLKIPIDRMNEEDHDHAEHALPAPDGNAAEDGLPDTV